MKIKIKPTRILLLIILLVDFDLFLLMPSTSIWVAINSNTKRYLEMVLCVGLFFWLYPYAKSTMKRDIRIKGFILYALSVICFISLLSMILYNESIIDVFTVNYYYLIMLLFFPIVRFFDNDNGVEKIANTIIVLSLLYCTVCNIQELIYLHSGKLILPGLYEDNYSFRDGGLRLTSNCLNQFAFIFICSKLWTSKHKEKKYLWFCALYEVFTQLYSYHTRTSQIIYVFILCFSYFISKRSNKLLRLLIIISVSAIAIQFFDIGAFVETFSINSVKGTGLSTLNRIGAVTFFLKRFIHNPLIGNGFIRESNIEFLSILHGGSTSYGISTYYYSDVGMVGLLAETGLLGLSLYLIMIVFMIKKAFYIYNIKAIYTNYEATLSATIAFFWVITSLTMIVTDPERIIGAPISLAILYYFDKFKIEKH